MENQFIIKVLLALCQKQFQMVVNSTIKGIIKYEAYFKMQTNNISAYTFIHSYLSDFNGLDYGREVDNHGH